MQRMHLVIILLLLGLELEVERDLIALIDDIAVALDHAADVEALHAGNGTQIFFRAGEERIGGVGNLGLGPEDDDVGKHAGVGINGLKVGCGQFGIAVPLAWQCPNSFP
jgi:hypothetical protein